MSEFMKYKQADQNLFVGYLNKDPVIQFTFMDNTKDALKKNYEHFISTVLLYPTILLL